MNGQLSPCPICWLLRYNQATQSCPALPVPQTALLCRSLQTREKITNHHCLSTLTCSHTSLLSSFSVKINPSVFFSCSINPVCVRWCPNTDVTDPVFLPAFFTLGFLKQIGHLQHLPFYQTQLKDALQTHAIFSSENFGFVLSCSVAFLWLNKSIQNRSAGLLFVLEHRQTAMLPWIFLNSKWK